MLGAGRRNGWNFLDARVLGLGGGILADFGIAPSADVSLKEATGGGY